MKEIKKILLTIVFGFLFCDSFSQDIKAGELKVTNISGNQYVATFTFYYEISNFVNRPYLLMNWGDGASDTIPWHLFYSGCGDSNTLTKVFSKTHTYAGDGTYLISCVDSFRINNLSNVSNSDLEKLSLEFNLIINSFYPPNNSSASINCLTDTWTGTGWVYNSGAYDSDGDSLVYNIIAPPGLTNYTFPSHTINGLTGDFTLSPSSVGEYAICMEIEEWKLFPSSTIRSYFGSTYRNILIDVNSLASINEVLGQGTIAVYPQPAHSIVSVEFEISDIKNAVIILKNTIGQTVKTINNNSMQVGKNKIKIDME